jgi:hypothetical protein
MFCQKCGEKLEDSQKFCHKCGESVTQEISLGEKSGEAEKSRKLSGAIVTTVFIVVFILVAVVVKYVVREGFSFLSLANKENQEQKVVDYFTNTNTNEWSVPSNYVFISGNQKFSINFPSEPQQEETAEVDKDFGQIKTITYSSSKDRTTYYVFVYEYSDPRMDDASEDFNVHNSLEGALNGMLNNTEDTNLISSKFTQLLNREALQYKIQVDNEVLAGILVFNGNRMYNITLDYFTDDNDLINAMDLSDFINSFRLNP